MGIAHASWMLVAFDAVCRKGCLVSLRLTGRDDPIIGTVVRAMDKLSQTFAVWPIGWSDPIVLRYGQLESAAIADLTYQQLRAVRERQRGGTL